jgi:flagellar biosynthesis protein FliR
MPAEITLSLSGLFGFLLVLARVSGVIVFVPFPGFKNSPDLARVVISVMLSVCLFSKWPAPAQPPGLATLTFWILAEAAFGITIGLVVSFLLEAFQLGAQVLSIQAGYSYASTIDPNTQADSGIIPVAIQLLAGMCFFITGVDRQLLRALAASFDRFPPGAFHLNLRSAEAVVGAGASMFTTGLRVALPVVAFLMLVDVALALLGRIQSQLQLLSLAFPAKMLAGLFMLASLAALFPTLFEAAAGRTMQNIVRLFGA